jgi:hypothetical protein
MAYLELVDEEYVAKEREARTPEPVAEGVSDTELVSDTSDEAQEDTEEVSDTNPVSDAGADESADEGDDGAGDADKPE